MKIPSYADVLETEQNIADMARLYRKKHPEEAARLEKEAVERFDHARIHEKTVHVPNAVSMIQLTKTYRDPMPLITADGNPYRLHVRTEGLFGRKKKYILGIPDDQYVVIDAILTYARDKHIPISFSWSLLSPKELKAHDLRPDEEPLWETTVFEWRAVTKAQHFTITTPKDYVVWFGIFIDL